MLVRGDQAEEMEARLSMLYAEIDSLTDQLAEYIEKAEAYDSLKAEYERLRTTLEVA